MPKEILITVNEFCLNHNIEFSFIRSLHQNGLIKIKIIEENWFISKNQLQQLEKYIRFYYDLDINLEGIETVTHLLQRILVLQEEIKTLQNRLRLYESDI